MPSAILLDFLRVRPSVRPSIRHTVVKLLVGNPKFS